jgi:hypothetical protein
LYNEARKRHGTDPAMTALNDVVASYYASLTDR